VRHHALLALDLPEKRLLLEHLRVHAVPARRPLARHVLLLAHLVDAPLPQALEVVVLQVLELVQLVVELVLEALGHVEDGLLDGVLRERCAVRRHRARRRWRCGPRRAAAAGAGAGSAPAADARSVWGPGAAGLGLPGPGRAGRGSAREERPPGAGGAYARPQRFQPVFRLSSAPQRPARARGRARCAIWARLLGVRACAAVVAGRTASGLLWETPWRCDWARGRAAAA
jgi:hypothetical protein